MDAYEIINTTVDDLPFIFNLFEEAIVYQKKKGFPVWQGYDKEIIKKEIEEKREYKIVSQGDIACVFSVCYRDPIIWQEKDKGDAIYLHRIVVNPKRKGEKHFEKIITWAIDFAGKNNLKYIRMDTWANNANIINYYKSFGFKFLEIFFTPNDPQLALQHRNMELALLEYEII